MIKGNLGEVVNYSDSFFEKISKLLEEGESVKFSDRNDENLPEKTWPIGHKIKGRFEIKDVKVGGMAVVYICYDHEFAMRFAVKSFKDKYLKEKAIVNRFFLEAESWMRLEKHKNIVWAKWVENINNRPYIFMEFIEGDKRYSTDLRGWIKERALSIGLSIDFAIQVCTGMIYAEKKMRQIKRPFVHRDLKPGNILVTSDKIVKITDFGISKVCAEVEGSIGSELTQDEWGRQKITFTNIGKVCGTPPYMSPEQCKGDENLDIRSDIYSFGCVLYEMLTGSTPFICETPENYMAQHLKGNPVPLKRLIPPIPQKLNDLVVKCLEKNSKDRYQTFEVVRDELNCIRREFFGGKVEYEDEGEELSAADLGNIAMSLYELGNSKESISYYDRVITQIVDELSPEMVARSFNNRGNCYSSLRDIEKALMNYELAKRIDPNYDFPWHNSASCYITIGDYKKALIESNRAISINSNFADSFARRADIHLYFRNYKEAIDDCNQAIRLEPKHVWAYRTRARIYESLGDKRKAMADYEMVKKLQMG